MQAQLVIQYRSGQSYPLFLRLSRIFCAQLVDVLEQVFAFLVAALCLMILNISWHGASRINNQNAGLGNVFGNGHEFVKRYWLTRLEIKLSGLTDQIASQLSP